MNYPMSKRMNNPITGEIKKSKYGNKKVIYQGIKFDSKKEKERYIILRELEQLGQISDLELQKKFELQPSYKLNGKKIREISYVSDFTYYKLYTRNDIPIKEFIVEDVKGCRTNIYKLKKKMFAYRYQTEITEVWAYDKSLHRR